MKTLIVLCSAFFIISGVSGVSGQQPPAVTGDKNLDDRNIKDRSIEIERVKRDEIKAKSGDRAETQAAPDPKFQQIKEDFEQIQMLQSDVVEAYTKGQKIDFAKISAKAEEINKRSTRLKENLFPSPVTKPDEAKPERDRKDEPPAIAGDVKTLIIEMDNTLAAFTSNPMFTNPQVVNLDSNAKAKSDLETLIKLSAALRSEAGKANVEKD